MNNVLSPLSLNLYGKGSEVKRELTRSIIPLGVLERAIDLQESLSSFQVGKDEQPVVSDISEFREQVRALTEFVVFAFDDNVTAEELNRGAAVQDMFALYRQIFAMVAQFKNFYQSPDGSAGTGDTEPGQTVKNFARRIKYLLLDHKMLGSMREIELTDFRSVLIFLIEYPQWKREGTDQKKYAFGDETDFA